MLDSADFKAHRLKGLTAKHAAMAAAIAGLCLITACQPATLSGRGAGPIADSIPSEKITTEPRRLAAKGIEQLDAGNLDAAIELFNKALYLDGGNSMLNFLTGLTYHLMALAGADAKYDLARQGYERATLLDNSNWIAHYHAGLLDLDLRDYRGAQVKFAEALILNPRDPDLLYYMAAASYYSGDLPTAEGVLRRLREVEPDSARVQQASAITLAALNQIGTAYDYADRLKTLIPAPEALSRVKDRVNDWTRFHIRNPVLLAQGIPQPEAQEPDAQEPVVPDTRARSPWADTVAPAPGAPDKAPVTEVQKDGGGGQSAGSQPAAAEPATPDANQMVIVDVVIIRTEEESTTAKGVNLLSNLTLQFGSTGLSTAGFSLSDTRTTTGDFTRTITRALNIPSITYSLNIANAADTRSEILARPTLTAMNGQPSEFFSGVSIKAQTLPSTAGGTGEAVSIEEDVGVKLNITPEVLEDGRVKMAVVAERTFLNTPNNKVTGFTSKIETSRTTVNANVTMNFNETLILSGLSEKETERTRDGVPLLQDLPIVQYFFSRQTTTDFNKSVLLLITPRLPEYVFRQPKKTSAGTPKESAVDEFRARHADWFRSYPNWASVFAHMQDNALYREFRTGDVVLDRWENNSSLSSRLKRALDFLFY
jgi:tetratricopeptide (TPR) repeat protein